MKQKRCPWCGKKIDISVDSKRVQKKRTPMYLTYAKCSSCNNYYGQSVNSRVIKGSILVACSLVLIALVSKLYNILFLLVLLPFIAMASPLEKMDENENLVMSEPVQNFKDTKKYFLIYAATVSNFVLMLLCIVISARNLFLPVVAGWAAYVWLLLVLPLCLIAHGIISYKRIKMILLPHFLLLSSFAVLDFVFLKLIDLYTLEIYIDTLSLLVIVMLLSLIPSIITGVVEKTRNVPMNKETEGTVVSISTQWWLKINTKPIRKGTFDGATFPHVIKVKYTVDGKEYIKKKWLGAGCDIPEVGATLTVDYAENRPEKAKVNYGKK